jgi:PAS domain S-box-containing protein
MSDVQPAQVSLTGWTLALRWVAVVCATVVVFLATALTPDFPAEGAADLWLGVGVLAVAAVGLTLVGPRRLATPGRLAAQIVFDAVVFAWMLHSAGGLANPFAALLAFQAIMAGLVMPTRAARAVGLGLALGIFVLGALEAAAILPPVAVPALAGVGAPLLASTAAVALLTAGTSLVVTTVVGALHRERLRLAEASDSLALEREKLRSIIDSMADAVIFADREGVVRLRNRAAEQLWPQGAAPVAEHDLRVCHDGATWARLLAKIADPSPEEHHPPLRANGRVFEPTYARVSSRGEPLGGVVMIARDITERIAAQAWQMREERMATVGKLAAGLAHELNNPLGSVVLYSQLALKATPGPTPVREHLETILRNADLCRRVLKDLLVYARQREPARTSVPVAELVGDVTRTLAAHAQKNGVEVAIELEATPPALDGDPDQLRQVLVNLGLNAIEAMPGGGRLVFRARGEHTDKVRLEVADTGPGVAEADRERIFTAFFTTKRDGTGLGLAIVRDLVDAHRGTIDVAPGSDRGAVFAITLPAARGCPVAHGALA